MLERRNRNDVDAPPGARGDGIAVRGEELQEPPADGADTGQSYPQSIAHWKRSERPVRLRGHGNDVMHRLGGFGEEFADVARRLADALLVLDEGDAHVALAVFAEANARRNRNA